MSEELTIFVPTEDSELRAKVKVGAGVVGSEVGGTGRIRIDFEGNEDLFGSFGARIRRAAERHLWTGPYGKRGYPTQACAYVSIDELISIGTYDPESKRVEVSDEAVLLEWLGTEEVHPRELSTE